MSQAQQPDQVTLETLLIDYNAAMQAAGADQVSQDRAMRDLKAGVQRLAAQDKSYEWLAKIGDNQTQLLNQLATIYQGIGDRAGQHSMDSDKNMFGSIVAFLQNVEQANFQNDMAPEQGASGIYRLCGSLRALCHVCGFQEGVDFFDNKISEWQASNRVNGSYNQLVGMKGHMVPNTAVAQQAVQGTTANGQGLLATQGSNVAAHATQQLVAGIGQGATTNGPLTNQPVIDPKNALELARQTINDIGVGAKLTQAKIDAISTAYEALAGNDAKLNANELTNFMGSKAVSDLSASNQQAVRQGLEDRQLVLS